MDPQVGRSPAQFQIEADRALIETVAAGVRDVECLHKRAAVEVVGAGRAGRACGAGIGMMRCVRRVERLGAERQGPFLTEDEFPFYADIRIDEAGASQDVQTATPEAAGL